MMEKCKCGCHLRPLSLGLALGILWALGLFVMALTALSGYGDGFVHGIGELYIGYKIGFLGAILGLIYGFIDGFIGGLILAWLYNLFACCGCSKCEKKEKI